MKKLNLLPKNKALLYFGLLLTIASIFFAGIFTLIQIILPIPLYVWLIPVIVLFIGIYFIVTGQKQDVIGYKFLDNDEEVIIVADTFKDAEKEIIKLTNEHGNCYKYIGESYIVLR